MADNYNSRLFGWSSRRRIEAKLDLILSNQGRIMATLADLQAAVAAEKTVEDSVVKLLETLSADLKAAIAANDPAALQAVVDQINSNAASLADAVTANTPAA